jgi:flagellar motor switch/type III secretory pathway protein FliN
MDAIVTTHTGSHTPPVVHVAPLHAGAAAQAHARSHPQAQEQEHAGLRLELGRRWIGALPASALAPGSVIEIDARQDDPVAVYAAGQLIAKGAVVTVEGKLAIRIRETVREAHGEQH